MEVDEDAGAVSPADLLQKYEGKDVDQTVANLKGLLASGGFPFVW